jgi:hypothetical protein
MTMTMEEIQAAMDAEAVGETKPAEPTEAELPDAQPAGKLRLKKRMPAPELRMQPEVVPEQAPRATPRNTRRTPGAFRSAMSLMTILLVLGAIVYFGWRFMRPEKVEPIQEVTAAVIPAAPVSRPAAPRNTQPAMITRDATCPTCSGSGKHRIPGSQLASSVYGCPVCGSKGTRTVRMAQGQRLCSDCSGMGRKGMLNDLFKTKRRYKAVRCTKCRGKGWM